MLPRKCWGQPRLQTKSSSQPLPKERKYFRVTWYPRGIVRSCGSPETGRRRTSSKPVCKARRCLKNKKSPPRRDSLGVFEKQNKKFGVLALTKLGSLVWRGQQFLKFILEFILLFMYVWVCEVAKRKLTILKLELTGNCEPPSSSGRNQTWILWKSNKLSEALSYPSSPVFKGFYLYYMCRGLKATIKS